MVSTININYVLLEANLMNLKKSAEMKKANSNEKSEKRNS